MIVKNCKQIGLLFQDNTSVLMPFEVINSIRIYNISNNFVFERDEEYDLVDSCECVIVCFNNKISGYKVVTPDGKNIDVVDRIINKKDIDIITLHFDNEFKAFRVPCLPDENGENTCQSANNIKSALSVIIDINRLDGQ